MLLQILTQILSLSKVVSERSNSLATVFTEQCRASLSKMLSAKAAEVEAGRKEKTANKVIEHVDDHISFSHLTRGNDPLASDDIFELSMSMDST